MYRVCQALEIWYITRKAKKIIRNLTDMEHYKSSTLPLPLPLSTPWDLCYDVSCHSSWLLPLLIPIYLCSQAANSEFLPMSRKLTFHHPLASPPAIWLRAWNYIFYIKIITQSICSYVNFSLRFFFKDHHSFFSLCECARTLLVGCSGWLLCYVHFTYVCSSLIHSLGAVC